MSTCRRSRRPTDFPRAHSDNEVRRWGRRGAAPHARGLGRNHGGRVDRGHDGADRRYGRPAVRGAWVDGAGDGSRLIALAKERRGRGWTSTPSRSMPARGASTNATASRQSPSATDLRTRNDNPTCATPGGPRPAGGLAGSGATSAPPRARQRVAGSRRRVVWMGLLGHGDRRIGWWNCGSAASWAPGASLSPT